MTGPHSGTDLPAPPPGAPFFLVEALPSAGAFLLDGPEGRHAATVRRMRPGQPLVLADGNGQWAEAIVQAAERSELRVEVGTARFQPPPALRVILVQALPKGDHSDLAVDLATEAGVDEIIPWQASRCVARWPAEKAGKGVVRWRSIAREAAKQARRPYVPRIGDLADTAGVRALIATSAVGIVLHEAESAPFTAVDLPSAGNLVLVVGPEGGIAPDELLAFTAAGATVARLGPEVLRSSAAAAVALGAIGALTRRWNPLGASFDRRT